MNETSGRNKDNISHDDSLHKTGPSTSSIPNPAAAAPGEEGQTFLIAKHRAFFRRCLNGLPNRAQELDTTRLTIVFFCVSGLDLLNTDENKDESLLMKADYRDRIIEWVYAHQVVTTTNENSEHGGDLGGCSGWASGGGSAAGSHLALSYAALMTLIILGDDLARVNRGPLLASVAASRLPDGSFSSHCTGGENDARFVYCAAAICYVLGDWSPFVGGKMDDSVRFIRACFNYDGGFGQRPRCESHGGSTYCCLAALKLMNRLTDCLTRVEIRRLRRWLVRRQTNGFHGRPNKPDDSCYTFWIAASLRILDDTPTECISGAPTAIQFALSCQDDVVGGFGKYSDSCPDALHSYLSLAGISLLSSEKSGIGIEPLDPALNVSLRASQALHQIHLRRFSELKLTQ